VPGVFIGENVNVAEVAPGIAVPVIVLVVVFEYH
jgi:hypothetical protein